MSVFQTLLFYLVVITTKTGLSVALIERGASVNDKDRDGSTPLHFTCLSGHTATVVALIERGASVNEKNQSGETPLHRACYSSHSATAIVLLENGAVGLNNRSGWYGNTPLYPACMYFALPMSFCE